MTKQDAITQLLQWRDNCIGMAQYPADDEAKAQAERFIKVYPNCILYSNDYPLISMA